MSNLKTLDRQPFEELFEMSSGYVLAPYLTNQTFQSFIAESVSKDIYAHQYTKYGDSKAKRLRAFWDIESDQLVAKVLAELVDFWEYKNPNPTTAQEATVGRCREIISRLAGKKVTPASAVTEEQFLKRDFTDVSIRRVPIETNMIPILDSRLQEAVRSLNANCPLSTVFTRAARSLITIAVRHQSLRRNLTLDGRDVMVDPMVGHDTERLAHGATFVFRSRLNCLFGLKGSLERLKFWL